MSWLHEQARPVPERRSLESLTREELRLPVLDGMRAFAILGVILSHVLALSGAVQGRGGAFDVLSLGVLGNVLGVFFIISGFVLFLPVVLRRGHFGDLGTYAVGRAARLLPAYWLSLAVVLVLAVALPLPQADGVPGLGSLALHFGALHMPARLFDGSLELGFGVNGPVWMISLIVAFYAVLPLLARPYARHPYIGLVIAALITAGWGVAVFEAEWLFAGLDSSSSPPWVVRLIAIDQFPGWAFSFALGMTGAAVYVRLLRSGIDRAVLARRALFVALGAALVYVPIAYLYGQSGADVNPTVAGSYARSSAPLSIGSSLSRAILMGGVALGPLWLQRPFSNRVARHIGGVSYGLYLSHMVVALYAAYLLGLPTDGAPATVALWLAIVLGVSFAYAEVSARFVERPIVARVRGLERRRREAFPTASRRTSPRAGEPIASGRTLDDGVGSGR